MPLFFMVSGFLSYKIYSWKDFVPFLKKKVSRLLLPWICTFGIIYFVRGSMGYWFLLCLFQISIIGFIVIAILEKINKKGFWIIDAILIGLIYIILRYFHVQDWSVNGMNLGSFANFFLPFFAGTLLRKYKSLFSVCIEYSWFYTCAFMAFLLFFCSRYLVSSGIIFELIYRYSSIVLSILGSLLIFHAFAKGSFIRLRPILSYLGKKTLPIYILHIMFVVQIPKVGEFILQQNAISSITIQLAYSIFLSGIAIGLSFILYKFIIISPLLRKILFGE